MSEEYRDNSIVFVTDDGEELEFTILKSLNHEGKEYILVTEDPESDDVEVQILRLDSEEPADDGESVQVFNSVDDPDELKMISGIFCKIFENDDIDIIVED